MISAVAFCPHPPALIPQLAAGAAGELAAMRAACLSAVARTTAPGRQLVLLGAGEPSRSHSPGARGTLAGYGVPLEVALGAPGSPGPPELPLSLTVGAWLVREALGPGSGAVGFSVGARFVAAQMAAELDSLAVSQDLALIVMGDGSARRDHGAPGSFDARAAPFDDTVLTALRDGDAAALASLDPGLGAAVLAAGVGVWRAAGNLLGVRRYNAEVLCADDRYGVGYFVAAWTARG